MLWLAVAVIAIGLLAMGLSEVEFDPGRPFPSWPQGEDSSGARVSPPEADLSGILKTTLALLFWVLLPISIIYLIFSRAARRRFLLNLAMFAALMLTVYLLATHFRPESMDFDASRPSGSGPEAGGIRLSPPAEVFDPPDWLITLVSVLLFAALVGIVWVLWHRTRATRDESLAELTQQAQETLEELRSGGDLKNAVLRCYREMQRILKDARGVSRPRDMTPREFEARLEESGLNNDHTRRLTRLFEMVRYGARVPSRREEREAEACLEEIVRAYGGSAS